MLSQVYLPEVLHGGQTSKGGMVPSRQWSVEEELRHNFGVIVHVGAHHPIGHCGRAEQLNLLKRASIAHATDTHHFKVVFLLLGHPTGTESR